MNRTTYYHRRVNRMLGAARNVSPSSEVIRELIDLTQASQDEPVKSDLVARLTVTRQNGNRTIVEVHAGAPYHSFYHFFAQTGNRRSTKRAIRIASRYEAPGLSSLAVKLSAYQAQSNPVVSTKIRIFKKREYRRLISARPDQLGLARTEVHIPARPFALGKR